MAKILNLESLSAKFNELRENAKRQACIGVTGFTANYALYVHENTEMKLAGLPRRPPGKGSYWDPQGQARPKFLEGPARENRIDIIQVVIDAYDKTKNLEHAILMGCLYLQRLAQLSVPVDTGNLKNSAFSAIEKGE